MTKLKSLIKKLAVTVAILGISILATTANGADKSLRVVANQTIGSIGVACLPTHHLIEICPLAHWHGGNEVLVPGSPRPKPSGETIIPGLDTYLYLNQSVIETVRFGAAEHHNSVPALYLTTLRLRL